MQTDVLSHQVSVYRRAASKLRPCNSQRNFEFQRLRKATPRCNSSAAQGTLSKATIELLMGVLWNAELPKRRFVWGLTHSIGLKLL